MLGVPQQVVAERRGRPQHGEQPHAGALVVDERVEQPLPVLDPVGEVGEVGDGLVGVGRRGDQVQELVGGVTETVERGGGVLDVLEAVPDQAPGRGGEPLVPHRRTTSTPAGSRHTAAKASASSRQVARSRSRAAATSRT